MEKSFFPKGSLYGKSLKCQNSGFRRHGESWADFIHRLHPKTSFQEPRASENSHLQTLPKLLLSLVIHFAPPKCFLKHFRPPKTCLNEKLLFWFGFQKQKRHEAQVVGACVGRFSSMYIALDGCQTFFLQRSEADATEGSLGLEF